MNTRPVNTSTLSLEDVTLVYPDGDGELTVLDDVDFLVGPGELVTLVGPSGSGKSSLLAVAGLLLAPTRGTVRVDGHDTTDWNESRRARARRSRFGFVFQQSNLVPSLTAVEQLELVTHINGGRAGRARERALELLDAVGLTTKAERRPHQLSGGERQRVGIARALMNDPAVLLADEPTSALDHGRATAIVDLLADLTHRFGTATIMVTHDTRHLDVSDRVVTIDTGRLFEQPAQPAPVVEAVAL